MFALFKDDEQVLKGHQHYQTAHIEAIECGYVVTGLTDFGPLVRHTDIINGYEIKEIEDDV